MNPAEQRRYDACQAVVQAATPVCTAWKKWGDLDHAERTERGGRIKFWGDRVAAQTEMNRLMWEVAQRIGDLEAVLLEEGWEEGGVT